MLKSASRLVNTSTSHEIDCHFSLWMAENSREGKQRANVPKLG
jgi:hypothetical protein